MKRVTLNFEVNAEPKKNGTFVIFLRATEQSRHYKMAVNAWVTRKENFSAQSSRRMWISSKESMAKPFNACLSDTMDRAIEAMKTLQQRGNLTAYNLISTLKNDNSGSVFSFIDKTLDNYKTLGRVANYNVMHSMGSKLREFTSGRDITFDEITFPFLQDFVTFLNKKTKKNGDPIGQTTISDAIYRLKTIYRQAIKEELVTNHSDPFIHIKLRKDKPHKVSLNHEELNTLINLNLEQGSTLWDVRNFFLFSIYTAGMRIGDVMRLKWSSIQSDRLVYRMSKTGKACNLKLTAQAQAILKQYSPEKLDLNDYIFPMIRKVDQSKDSFGLSVRNSYINTKVNTALREIAQMAKIQKRVSFHIARHTFASIAASQGSVFQVSQLLGHSSIAITQHYLHEINPKAQDDFMDKLALP